MGTPQLAAYILEGLLGEPSGRFEVVGVVTRPDSARKRGLRLEPSEVGAVAARHSLPTLKPTRLKTGEFLNDLAAFRPDLLVIAAYGRILPQAVLEVPRIMPLNVHASLLPRFRGAAPIEGAILAGERETGVTIMRVIERMDAGPILLQRRIEIAAAETQGSLKDKLAKLGFETLVEALTLLQSNKFEEIAQDDTLATYTSPISKEDGVIDWTRPAIEIEHKVRAFDPWPVARTLLGAEDLLVWRTATDSASRDEAVQSGDEPAESALPGTIVALRPNPTVQCGAGRLVLLEVQAPGKKRMPAADFIRGRRVGIGARLGG
jgi:methionyl-tRNA formyltransferase